MAAAAAAVTPRGQGSAESRRLAIPLLGLSDLFHDKAVDLVP